MLGQFTPDYKIARFFTHTQIICVLTAVVRFKDSPCMPSTEHGTVLWEDYLRLHLKLIHILLNLKIAKIHLE